MSKRLSKGNDEDNFLEASEEGMGGLSNSVMTQYNSGDKNRKDLVISHQRPQEATTRWFCKELRKSLKALTMSKSNMTMKYLEWDNHYLRSA